MFIDDKAIDYRKKQGAEYFIVHGKKNVNVSGCGCTADSGVITISAVVDLGFGEPPNVGRLEELGEERVYILPQVESCLEENTKIKLDRMLMIKSLSLENVIPIVVKEN